MHRPLFEFEDQPWFPHFLRQYQTDFLGFIAEYTGLYTPANEILEDEASRNPKIVCDLASGAGLAALGATKALRDHGWQLILTDRFPNTNAIEMVQRAMDVSYMTRSLNALIDPLPQASVYTIFNAFHHFSPSERIQIGHAVKKNGGKLLVFEPVQPSLFVFIKVALVTTIGLFITAPFIKPFSIKRLILTYIIPIGVLITFWDGLVSVLRGLSKNEIQIFAQRASQEGLSVSHTSVRSKLARLTYISIE